MTASALAASGTRLPGGKRTNPAAGPVQSGGAAVRRRSAASLAAVLVAGLLPAWALGVDSRPQGEDPAGADARMVYAWRTLRAVECARCHGKDYDGLAAPSIVEYARSQSREMFVRMVLDGTPARGMPGYRNNPRVRSGIDDIYRYFQGRAAGTVRPGKLIATP